MTEIFPRFTQNCLTVSFCVFILPCDTSKHFWSVTNGKYFPGSFRVIAVSFSFSFAFLRCVKIFETFHIVNKDVPQMHTKKTFYLSIFCDVKPATLLKATLLHGCFLRFLNCTNGTKSHKASHFKIHTKGIWKYKVTITCVRKVHTLELQLKRYVRYNYILFECARITFCIIKSPYQSAKAKGK